MDWLFVERDAEGTGKRPGGVPSGAVELFFDGQLHLGRALLDFFVLVLLDLLVLVVDAPLHDQGFLGARQDRVMAGLNWGIFLYFPRGLLVQLEWLSSLDDKLSM